MDDVARIEKDLEIIVYNVTEWAKDLLLWYIEQRIYLWGEEQKQSAYMDADQKPYYAYGTGHATGQLYRSITAEKQLDGVMKGLVVYLLFSDPEKLEYEPEEYIHGDKEHDYRNTILQRLNEAMDDYGLARVPWWTSHSQFGHYHFFDDFLAELERDIYVQFEKEMSKIGWAWQRTGAIPDEHIFMDI